MKMPELKPCPFGGGEAKLIKCGNEVVSKLYDEPMDAVWAWNKVAEDGK